MPVLDRAPENADDNITAEANRGIAEIEAFLAEIEHVSLAA